MHNHDELPPQASLSINEFTYILPENRIAPFPLPNRDESKLLQYRQGEITETTFRHLPLLLPKNSLLVFNDTRVVHARLHFSNDKQQQIEVFCLEPVAPVAEVQLAMQQTAHCTWKCLVGNARKWKAGALTKTLTLQNREVALQVEKISTETDYFILSFSWQPEHLPFADVLEQAGQLPLPPYFNRPVTVDDEIRYQTVYAQHNGSVAAPTAGLHFTPAVMDELLQNQVDCRYLTLHVGAGTFRPVKAETMAGHHMHTEEINVTLPTLKQLSEQASRGPIIAVGTTSLRTLESLYWFGLSLYNGAKLQQLEVSQWQPYQQQASITLQQAILAIITMLQRTGQQQLTGRTGILISPGYQFQVADALITNFHQPSSTLLLLVAAFIGNDWKKVYDYALAHEFRFLSYGDSSLLWRK